MQNTETNTASQPAQTPKKPFMKGNMPLVIGGVVLCAGSVLLGYTVGHRQGLTVVGFDADAEQLVEVVKQQKTTLATLNKNLNAAVQERDVAVSNSNDLLESLNKANAEKSQVDAVSYTHLTLPTTPYV